MQNTIKSEFHLRKKQNDASMPMQKLIESGSNSKTFKQVVNKK